MKEQSSRGNRFARCTYAVIKKCYHSMPQFFCPLGIFQHIPGLYTKTYILYIHQVFHFVCQDIPFCTFLRYSTLSVIICFMNDFLIYLLQILVVSGCVQASVSGLVVSQIPVRDTKANLRSSKANLRSSPVVFSGFKVASLKFYCPVLTHL